MLPVLESLFNSEYCEVLNITFFEKHLRTAASEDVFGKLRKFKEQGRNFNFTLIKLDF